MQDRKQNMPRREGFRRTLSPQAPKSVPTLKPRRSPVQERGRRRLAAIIDAAEKLLVDKGFSAVTTRAIAEVAGLPVGSIYQFFPNKFAILNALALRYLEEVGTRYAQFLVDRGDSLTWEEALDAGIDAVGQFIFEHEAMVVLWAGLQSAPDLHLAESQVVAQGVSYNMALLERALPDTDEATRGVMAKIMVGVIDSVLSAASVEDPPARAVFVDELKVLLKSYVKGHVGGQSRPPASPDISRGRR